jgi:hypothetical protein
MKEVTMTRRTSFVALAAIGALWLGAGTAFAQAQDSRDQPLLQQPSGQDQGQLVPERTGTEETVSSRQILATIVRKDPEGNAALIRLPDGQEHTLAVGADATESVQRLRVGQRAQLLVRLNGRQEMVNIAAVLPASQGSEPSTEP